MLVRMSHFSATWLIRGWTDDANINRECRRIGPFCYLAPMEH